MSIKINSLDITTITSFLDSFIDYTNSISNINTKLKNRKIRNPNFPSEISENLVKLYLQKKEGKIAKWDISKGDIYYNGKLYEVKAYTSHGPSSFGPNERWDILFFVDAINYKQKKFKIYKVKLSNNDDKWLNIKVNSTQTFKDQCNLIILKNKLVIILLKYLMVILII